MNNNEQCNTNLRGYGPLSNGSRRNAWIGLASLVVPLLSSVLGFWIWFYPQIATIDFVKDYVKTNGPYNEERQVIKYRFDRIDIKIDKLDNKLDKYHGGRP